MSRRRSRKPRTRKLRFGKHRTGKGHSRGGMVNWWVLWRAPVLMLIVMTVWWFVFRPIAEERDWAEVPHDFALCGEGRSRACVIDGDTLAIGFGPTSSRTGARRIRLTGYDAPELDGACKAERELAITARTALHDWLAQGRIEWDGSDEPPRDKYGRELRSVRRINADGSRERLADTMIARGLASESGWGSSKEDWCD